MKDQSQNSNINIVPVEPAPVPVQTAPQAPMDWKSLLSKIRSMLINIFNKLYSNKKIFWPVSIAFGLIFLIIILGILFGKRNPNQNITKLPTPTPTLQNTPQASAFGDILINSQNKLNDLKNQINALDIKQSRFQPPTLNFNIKF